MDKEYSIKEAADYLGITTNKLVAHTIKGEVGKAKTRKGEPFRYTKESLDKFTSKKSKVTSKINEAEKDGDGAEILMTAAEAASYLGVTKNAIQTAAQRKRIVPDATDKNNRGARLFKKSTIDAYKRSTGLTKEATIMSHHMLGFSKKDGYETAGQLLTYCKTKGYENPWEAIKDLLDANGQN